MSGRKRRPCAAPVALYRIGEGVTERDCSRFAAYKLGDHWLCWQHANVYRPKCDQCNHSMSFAEMEASRTTCFSCKKPATKVSQAYGWGFVYFMAGYGLVKIGFSSDLSSRLKNIQSMSPCPIVLAGAIESTQPLEAALHERFAHLRQHGEWFTDCAELRDYIAEHASLPSEGEEAA